MKPHRLEQDEAVLVDIDGTRQRLRLRAARRGLPPLLIVQGGPGLPLLNEVSRFHGLSLEKDWTVAYWDQRGCGDVPRKAAEGVTLELQLEDLSRVIQRLSDMTGSRVALLGISIGGTLAMRAAARMDAIVSEVIAVSPDLNTALGDEHGNEALTQASMGSERLARALRRLGPPPYVDAARFQERLRLIANIGGIERGSNFATILGDLLLGLIGRYGPIGAIVALRNAAIIQARLLPALVTLDLLTIWPTCAVPFHLVFGEEDIFTPPSIIEEASRRLKDEDSLIVLPRAAHMAHFDQPDAVRDFLRSKLSPAQALQSASV